MRCSCDDQPNHRLQRPVVDDRLARHGIVQGEGQIQEVPDKTRLSAWSRSCTGLGIRRRRVLLS